MFLKSAGFFFFQKKKKFKKKLFFRSYSSISDDARIGLFKALKSGLDSLRKNADKFLASKPASSIDVYKQELSRYVQPLNMLGYVLSLSIIEAEKMEIEVAKGKGRTKKEKGTTLEGWQAGSSLKEKTLVSILILLDLELARFWSLTHPESEFCLLWTKIAGAMMENPANFKGTEQERCTWGRGKNIIFSFNRFFFFLFFSSGCFKVQHFFALLQAGVEVQSEH